MSITSVHLAINRHLRSATIKGLVSESFVDGENVQTYAADVIKELAVFPLSNRDLRYLPEGEYTAQDRKFYELGEGTIKDKSEIEFDGIRYIVDGGTQRNFEGGFTTYVGKRIDTG